MQLVKSGGGEAREKTRLILAELHREVWKEKGVGCRGEGRGWNAAGGSLQKERGVTGQR